MPMRQLPVSSMIIVCGYLLEEARQVLQLHPLLKAIVPEIEQVRNALIESQPQGPISHEDEKKLRLQLRTLDAQHDAQRRALFFLLEAATHALQEESDRQLLSNAQKELFPTRLKINNQSIDVEAGEAIRLPKRLQDSPDLQKAVGALSLRFGKHSFSASELVSQLAETGQEMESCLNKLYATQHKNEQASNTPTTPLEHNTRLSFFRLIRTLQQIAALVLSEQPHEQDLLFKALNEELLKHKQEAPPKSHPTPEAP